LTLVNWTAELLWFQSLGYEDVFWRLRLAKLAMFAAAFGVVFAYAYFNLHILGRLADLSSVLGSSAQGGSLRTWPTQPGAKAAHPQGHQLTRPFVLASVMAATIFGLIYYSEWDRLLRLAWAQQFGTSDPIFHRDVGFYLFVLPFLNLAQGGLELLTFTGLLLLAFAYYAAGVIQFSARSLAATNYKVLAHLIANAVLLLAICVWGFYLDRYDLLVSPPGLSSAPAMPTSVSSSRPVGGDGSGPRPHRCAALDDRRESTNPSALCHRRLFPHPDRLPDRDSMGFSALHSGAQ
jgi:uncharacterized membrane protein (UPF0182 family)